MSTSTRRTLMLSFVAFALPLAGCAALGGPRTVTISEADLQRALEGQFPFDGRLLELIDLRITSPRLRLLPESNRLATELDVRIGERLLAGGYRGSMALDYGLRYDDSDHSVRLEKVRVQHLRFGNLPASLASALDRVGPLVAEQLLDGMSIYRLEPDEVRTLRASGHRAEKLDVTPRGVQITLVPQP